MKKLLVVDDEHDICDFVKNFFEERGFCVFTAQNGDDALSIAKRESPGMVLLDMKMKGMDGLATLKHLKEINKAIKVVMVTALDGQEQMNEACRMGACEYITKPLVLDELERAVERIYRNEGVI